MSDVLTALLIGFLLTVWIVCGALLAREAVRFHRAGIARVRAAQARQDARDDAFVTALRDTARRPSWLDPRNPVPPQRGASWERS